MNGLFLNLLNVTKNVGAEIIDKITPNNYNLRDLKKKYTIKDISDDKEWVFLCLEQLNNVGRIGNGRHAFLQWNKVILEYNKNTGVTIGKQLEDGIGLRRYPYKPIPLFKFPKENWNMARAQKLNKLQEKFTTENYDWLSHNCHHFNRDVIEQIFDKEFNSLPKKAQKELLYQDNAKKPWLKPWLKNIISINSDSVSGNFVQMTAEEINEVIQPNST